MFGVVAVMLAITTANLSAAQGTAKVIKLKGAARYSMGNDVWQKLHEGDTLNSGAVIQTASDSQVDLVLGEGAPADLGKAQPTINHVAINSYSAGESAGQNVVRLTENTVLALDKLYTEQTGADTVADTELDLRAGRIMGNVKKLSAASKFEIKLPNGVAGIRGTIYDISANGILSVFDGSVVISYYLGGQLVTKVVNAGEQLEFKTGVISQIPAGTPTPNFPTVMSQPSPYVYVPGTVTYISPTAEETGTTPPPPAQNE